MVSGFLRKAPGVYVKLELPVKGEVATFRLNPA